MSDQNQQIAESIRSGEYFEEARSWYKTVCLGPISERSFFLIISVLATLVGVFSLVSLMVLMPLVTKPPIAVAARDSTENYVPRLVRLRERKGDADHAIERFMVLQYLNAREGYDAKQFTSNAAFVRAQSTAEVYGEYYAQQQPSNPQSFTKALGQAGTQTVTPLALDFDWERAPATAGQAATTLPDKTHIATIHFMTEAANGNQSIKSQWTATLKYTYTKVTITDEKDPKNSMSETQVTDPKFQVISYVVTKDAS